MNASVTQRWVLGVASAVLGPALLIGGYSATARESRARPHLSEHRILRIALTAAARSGDPTPTLIQHSQGTRHNANLVDSGDSVPGSEWSYLIAERGHFVLNDASRPRGARPPTGSALTLIVDATNGTVTDSGVSNRYPRLARLGPVRTDLRHARAPKRNT
jgi:hypothetical protein